MRDKAAEERSQPNPSGVRVDDRGRFIDAEGNLVNMQPGLISTLKINQKREKERRVRQLIKLEKDPFSAAARRESKYYDPAVEEAQRRRDRRKLGAFSFVEQGTFIKRGEQLRKKQTLELLDSADMMPTVGPSVQSSSMPSTSSAIARILSRGNRVKPPDPIPEVEWWDAVLLPPGKKSFQKSEGQYAITEADLLMKRITDLVQHPTVVKNEYIEKLNNSAIKVLLTDKEHKKISRMKRLEKEKDKQEKIRLGLAPPPPPKIKMSNYLQILSKEAVADPSKTEAEVKKMVEERMMGHLRHNLERKLTPQQKYDKMKRKLNRDLNEECRTALFRIETLVCPTHRFKIDVNAQQYMLTGLCIIPDKALSHRIPTLVVVEGGPWAIKKYKKLLLRRMKWASPAGGLTEEERTQLEKQLEGNRSALVWEGVLKKRIFDKWKVVDVRSDNEARRILADKAVDHYWNMVISYKYGDDKTEITNL